MTTGIAIPAEDAFRIALSEMILGLEEDYGFSRGEACLFLGQAKPDALSSLTQLLAT